MTDVNVMRSTLSRIKTMRDNFTPTDNSSLLIELSGGHIIEPMSYEPDPSTYRQDFYYNSTTDQIYKKVIFEERKDGITIAYWVPYRE